MSPVSACRRLWRSVRARFVPAPSQVPRRSVVAPCTDAALSPRYSELVTLWPDLTVTECALAATDWEALSPAQRRRAYAAAVGRAARRAGRERFGTLQRFLSHREFDRVPAPMRRAG